METDLSAVYAEIEAILIEATQKGCIVWQKTKTKTGFSDSRDHWFLTNVYTGFYKLTHFCIEIPEWHFDGLGNVVSTIVDRQFAKAALDDAKKLLNASN